MGAAPAGNGRDRHGRPRADGAGAAAAGAERGGDVPGGAGALSKRDTVSASGDKDGTSAGGDKDGKSAGGADDAERGGAVPGGAGAQSGDAVAASGPAKDDSEDPAAGEFPPAPDQQAVRRPPRRKGDGAARRPRQGPVGAVAGEVTDGAPDDEGATGDGPGEQTSQARAPWHFKVLLVGTVVYLGWRLYQGIGWLVHHL